MHTSSTFHRAHKVKKRKIGFMGSRNYYDPIVREKGTVFLHFHNFHLVIRMAPGPVQASIVLLKPRLYEI